MQSIRQVQRLNEAELEKCVPPNASWHTDYRDTAYVYIGGLPFELSEGDILTIFSQYGNPVHINLMRDKDTGKSRGFCFLKYEDQRSCDLAVDNLSGAGALGRVLRVDHTRYEKKEGEVEGVGDEEVDETDEEDDRRRKRRRTESLSEESEEERPLIKEEIELAKLMREHDDDDPMKAYLIEEKRAEVEEALKAVVIQKPKDAARGHKRSHKTHRSRRHASPHEGRRSERDRHRSRRDDHEDEDTRNHHESRRSRRNHSTSSISDEERDTRTRHSRRDEFSSRVSRHERQDRNERSPQDVGSRSKRSRSGERRPTR